MINDWTDDMISKHDPSQSGIKSEALGKWSKRPKVDLLLSPFILPTNLIFLLRSEVILDVERLANLLG